MISAKVHDERKDNLVRDFTFSWRRVYAGTEATLDALEEVEDCWSTSAPPQDIKRQQVGRTTFLKVYCQDQAATNEVFVIYKLTASNLSSKKLAPLRFEQYDCELKRATFEKINSGFSSFSRNKKIRLNLLPRIAFVEAETSELITPGLFETVRLI